jgi:FKBP-type peptidyl-prolyl cis-trans isomerase
MDSKIKTFPILAFAILAFSLSGCRQDNWMDWKLQNDMWLAHNKTQPGVRTTSSGLQYRIIADPLAENNDAKPKPNSTVVCDYTVKLINGTIIESRQKTDSTESGVIYLASAIPGFQEGCIKVHTHGDIELFIPADLGYDYNASDERGYGTEGHKTYIPPYSTLIYTVHICGFY